MAPQPVPPGPAKPASESKSSLASSLQGVKVGETTIDDAMAFEVELAGYAELHALTTVLRERLDPRLRPPAPADGAPPVPAEPAQLFFVDNALRLALDTASVIELQLKSLKEAYQSVSRAAAAAREPSPADALDEPGTLKKMIAVPGTLPAAAQAAVALLGALRTDTRYSGRQVKIPEQAFALALAHEWEASKTVHFHYPTLFVPPSSGTTTFLQAFVTLMDAVAHERSTASEALTKLLVRVSQMDASAPGFPAAKAALDIVRNQFAAAEAVFDGVSARLSKVDDKTGLNQLQLLERAGFVMAIAAKAGERAFYLFAQVVSAGGAFRISKNVLRTLFWGPALEHAGGCVVSYGLFSANGRLIAADTIGNRSAYKDSRPPIQVR